MMTGSSAGGFERAEHERRRLIRIVSDVGVIADGLKAAAGPGIHRIGEKVASETFRVMVVGEFKRGKSTLINALLGGTILPVFARPATAVLTELRWAEKPGAVLHPADGGEPVPVDVAHLEQEITIPRGVKQGSAETSRWKLAELGWPLDLLRNGVVLIDSPGLNEHEVRQEVTMRNLPRADAIVFVQDAQHSPSMEESRFLRMHLDTYDVFFVINKINIIDEWERKEAAEEIVFRVRQHRPKDRHDRFHIVDARRALRARIADDEDDWRASAVAAFADELTTYLATDRHRAKLLGPARELFHEIRNLRQDVAAQRALTEQETDDLRQRQQDAQAPLRRLAERARQIRHELDLDRRHLQAAVRADAHRRLLRIASETPEIVAVVTPEAKLSLKPWKSEASAKAFAEELATGASAEMTSRFRSGQREDFARTLEAGLKAMSDRADLLIRGFMRDFSQVRQDLTGVDLAVATGDGDADEDSLAAPDVGDMNLTGDIEGKHFLWQLGAIYALVIGWAFTPWGLTSLIVGVLTANAVVLRKGKGVIENKVRKVVSGALADELRDNAGGHADRCAEEFGAGLATAIDTMMSRVDTEIRQLRAQVDEALSILAAGEDAIRRRQDQLAQWDAELDKNAAAVGDLIADVEMA